MNCLWDYAQVSENMFLNGCLFDANIWYICSCSYKYEKREIHPLFYRKRTKKDNIKASTNNL